jgi:hypothetical protein
MLLPDIGTCCLTRVVKTLQDDAPDPLRGVNRRVYHRHSHAVRAAVASGSAREAAPAAARQLRAGCAAAAQGEARAR